MNKTTLSREMGVSRGSLYYKSILDPKDEKLRDQILAVLQQHKAYGHKRIALHLGINKKRVLRVMKKYNITPIIQQKKKQSRKGATSEHFYKNWLDKLCPIAPDVVWASDFTYIFFQKHWWYLATIIDVYTREIVGVAFSCYHNQDLVTSALNDALSQRSIPYYLHSDRGSEYNGHDYTSFATSLGITLSMSPKGKPWKNGFQESFYSNFKLELGSVKHYQTSADLLEAIYQQLYYYNNKRIHTALRMPPSIYAAQHNSS